MQASVQAWDLQPLPRVSGSLCSMCLVELEVGDGRHDGLARGELKECVLHRGQHGGLLAVDGAADLGQGEQWGRGGHEKSRYAL